MPRRTDLKSILIIGSGPIIIGQACEFDYSGVQACKALREEGYKVILVNSNPATIMTDPEFADRTYIEPITPAVVEMIMAKEKPDALLPTLGGQTALNTAMALHESGALTKHGVKLIGAQVEAIRKGKIANSSRSVWQKSVLNVPSPSPPTPWRSPGQRWKRSALSRLSFDPRSPWAAPAGASPITAKSSKSLPPQVSTPPHL